MLFHMTDLLPVRKKLRKKYHKPAEATSWDHNTPAFGRNLHLAVTGWTGNLKLADRQASDSVTMQSITSHNKHITTGIQHTDISVGTVGEITST